MAKRCFFLVTIVMVLQTSFSRAQESMMTDISYVFLEKLIATAKENYPKGWFKSNEQQPSGFRQSLEYQHFYTGKALCDQYFTSS